MTVPQLSQKGQDLITLYEQMAREGFDRTNNKRVESEEAYSRFNLRDYKDLVAKTFSNHPISTVLDYGCGGSDWQADGFDEATNNTAVKFFGLSHAYRYEPARDIDERQPVDAVISFDVLEHIFIADVPNILRDMFSYADKLLFLNVACYKALALLPNGENAHITARPPAWWKGMVDSISIEYPEVSVCLLCSTEYRKSKVYPVWSAKKWAEQDAFVVTT